MRGLICALAVLGGLAAAAAPASAQTLPPILQPPPPEDPPPSNPPPSNPPPSDPPPSPTGPAPAPLPAPDGTVALGVDMAHTGHLADDALVPPLRRIWTKGSGDAKQLLAIDGRVYALEWAGLTAYDAGSGRKLWHNDLAPRTEGMTYDAGGVYVTWQDYLIAFDAATGTERWRTKIADVAGPGTPVASDGVVFVMHGQGGGTLHAYSESDGHQIWVAGANYSRSPALDSGRVYVGSADEAYAAFNRSDGSVVYKDGYSQSGHASVAAIFAGRLFAVDGWYPKGVLAPGAAVDLATGKVAWNAAIDRPVFVDGTAVASDATSLRALDPTTGAVLWQGGKPLASTIAVGHDVYGFRLGGYGIILDAVDSESGALIWSATLPGGMDHTSEWGAQTAASQGRLFVTATDGISAYESVLKPAPGEIAVEKPFETLAGRRFGLIGVLGTSLRGARPPVTVERAGWRRGAFRPVAKVTPLRDGGFAAPVTVNRNARFRVVAGGVRSRATTVYADPYFALGKARASGSRVAVGVTVKSPGVKLGGRSVVLYLNRHGTKRLRLVGSGGLRAAGSGKSRATVRFVPLSNVDDRDVLYLCVRGQLGLGLGRPTTLTRRCGAARLPKP